MNAATSGSHSTLEATVNAAGARHTTSEKYRGNPNITINDWTVENRDKFNTNDATGQGAGSLSERQSEPWSRGNEDGQIRCFQLKADMAGGEGIQNQSVCRGATLRKIYKLVRSSA